jgi:hypothetical protein
MQVSVRRIRVRSLAFVVGALVATTALIASPATSGATEYEEPLFVEWSSVLPSYSGTYDPTSSNVCVSGKDQCVDAVIREMERRWRPLDEDCDHNVMFSLMYLRTTEEYQRSALTPGFFTDPAFINHQDAGFAKQYFDAWDWYRRGDLAATPDSWEIAFKNADQQAVSGTGNMLLGMSAHVNRALPHILAQIGLVKPDGTSRKPDHDKVNQFLNLVMEPLLNEAADRYDPTVDDAQVQGTTVDETAMLQLLVGWREQAWRNAEALVNAPTPAARALVEAEIDRVAALEANLIVAATSYSPLNAQAALNQLAALGATPAETLQAQLDRTANQLRGIVGSLFSNPVSARNRYCTSQG